MLNKLKEYQTKINDILQHFFIDKIDNFFLKEMSQYALSDGKRLRSIMALDIYLATKQYNKVEKILETDLTFNTTELQVGDKKMGFPVNIYNLIICVELLHTVSIVLDDLPSMDNDKIRRNKPTVHIKYGNSNANILASFLMQQSFKYLNLIMDYKQYEDYSDFLEPYLVKLKSDMLKEMMIATEGQHLDLNKNEINNKNNKYWEYYGNNKDLNLNMVSMKTAPFFCIGFCGAYMLARIEYCIDRSNVLDLSAEQTKIIMERTMTRYQKIKESSYLFSYGFQISDDILDMETDNKDEFGMSSNYVHIVGLTNAKKTMINSLNEWRNIINKMFIWTQLMEELYQYISNRK
jgi:geranylgeranyl pyrophosphate synthase